LQKRKVLSLEWKSEGVMDNEGGELMELMEEVPLKELGDAKVEVFIKYEAKVSNRVSVGDRGVVDFGKLFTETDEQKFSLGGVQCKKICSHPGRNLI